MDKKSLEILFQKTFGEEGEVHSYFAPGRVNLIGEHTDYNGGHVFPCALTLGTYGAVRKREDRRLRLYSVNFEQLGIMESDLDSLVPDKAAGWTNYPKGVMWTFEQKGWKIPCGMDILFYGDIPNGSGLSSSASIEVLTGFMLNELFGFGVSLTEIAQIGQYSENQFNGCNCGIMDQFASAMGKADHAIFLDTNTLTYEYAPVALADARIVIVNSKVKHSLVDSAYNDRRRECEKALEELQQVVAIHALGELSEEEFEQHKDAIESEIRKRRAKHAVYENQRTIKAVAALTEGKIEEFGHLMNESHISLRDDYEVSCKEINLLVELAWNTEGVIGARMTGGGFGGCTVNVVKKEAIDHFTQVITEKYEQEVGHKPEIYLVDIGDGAHSL